MRSNSAPPFVSRLKEAQRDAELRRIKTALAGMRESRRGIQSLRLDVDALGVFCRGLFAAAVCGTLVHIVWWTVPLQPLLVLWGLWILAQCVRAIFVLVLWLLGSKL